MAVSCRVVRSPLQGSAFRCGFDLGRCPRVPWGGPLVLGAWIRGEREVWSVVSELRGDVTQRTPWISCERLNNSAAYANRSARGEAAFAVGHRVRAMHLRCAQGWVEATRLAEGDGL